jgi:hypothetical protein
MKLLKNLALFLLLFPLAVLAIVRPHQARRIARDAVAEYRKRR